MVEPAVTQPEPESCPELVVEYYPDTQTLVVDDNQRRCDGEDIAHGLTVFYDAADKALGFVLEGAELELPAFVAAVRAADEQRPENPPPAGKRPAKGGETRPEPCRQGSRQGIELPPLPAVVEEYCRETDTLIIHFGAELASRKPVARGLAVFYDAAGQVAGFRLQPALTCLQPLAATVRAKARGDAVASRYTNYPTKEEQKP